MIPFLLTSFCFAFHCHKQERSIRSDHLNWNFFGRSFRVSGQAPAASTANPFYPRNPRLICQSALFGKRISNKSRHAVKRDG
jgi:hypothetical protein